MANKTVKENAARKDRIQNRLKNGRKFFQNPAAVTTDDFVWLGFDGSDAAMADAAWDLEQTYNQLTSHETLLAEVLLSIAMASPGADRKPLPHVRVTQAMNNLLNQKKRQVGKPRDKRDDAIILEIAALVFAEETGFATIESLNSTARQVLRKRGETDPLDDRVRHIIQKFNKNKDAYLRLASVWSDARQQIEEKVANAVAAIEALGVPVSRTQGRYFPN
ncbi:hypothetical protein [Devosia sp. A449]